MPFIDTTPASFTHKVTENDLQPRLGDLLQTAGWTVAANFKKIVLDAELLKSGAGSSGNLSYPITVAEHFIYANKLGHMFGVAITGRWSMKYADFEVKPTTQNLESFGDSMTKLFHRYRSPQTLYVYIVEKLNGLAPNGKDIVLAWKETGEAEQLRAAVDIEVESSVWKANSSSGNPTFTIDKADGTRMQSPIMQAGLRANFMEQYFDSTVNSTVQYTNWWPDSEISIRGTLSEDTLFFILQADNVPAPEGNLVPIIPLYFGKLDAVEEGDDAYALFAGTVPLKNTAKEVAEYDYDNTADRQPNIMPILKTYPSFPANGLDNVMIHRSKLGARYQAHYLSWNSPANAMPPARTSADGKRDYPRAWNNAENPLYKYNFNPSRYSGKVHTSKVYVVHPEEGVRGSLKDAVALSAFSFNANKLRIKKNECPDEFDVYRYFLVEGVSPLTKKPGTQFRPAGIGLFLNTVDKEGNEVS
ncbi:hypothetical protein [Paenibacillus tengchongensis]|uniref:hypothetical protein n=1 Tax=Paenibacillus tengchongensis TaxID=2608684 RepID=UPI00124CA83B|nr:hypothetical protein [Paenibacillus tengchongensis]